MYVDLCCVICFSDISWRVYTLTRTLIGKVKNQRTEMNIFTSHTPSSNCDEVLREVPVPPTYG